MRNFIYIFLITILFIDFTAVCQTTGNIPLLCKTKFGRAKGSGDVWGVQISGVNYSLSTLDGGLSIINTNNTTNPIETAHINHSKYITEGKKLFLADVETFAKNGITYAYLATDDGDNTDGVLVIIINLNQAIEDGGEILIDPVIDTPDPNSVFAGKINDLTNVSLSHTLTIAGDFLYVANLDNKLPIWDLNSNPTNPSHLGTLNLTSPETFIHEMYVKDISQSLAKVYAACVEGGLQVFDVTFNATEEGSYTIQYSNYTVHLYDFDKAYPDQMESGDPLFNYRATHSAWPTDDGSYIFTTDELLIWPPGWPYQYSGEDRNLYGNNSIPALRSPRREGPWLRTWDAALLGNTSSYKGGYFAAEDYYQGITDLSIIDTNWVPNSIHQMHSKGDYLFVAHYSEGFRMLDISDPENIIELGYYDDYPEISFDPSSDYFFRSVMPGGGTWNWAAGIYGVFPDKNRPNICYAGGTGGFYIFDVTIPTPEAPTGFTLSGSTGENPTLSWNASSDVGLDGYKLYQKWGSGSYFLRVTLDKNTTSFTDQGVIIGGGRFDPRTCYIVTAFNINGIESAPSFPRCTGYSGVSKSVEPSEVAVVSYEFNLLTAYPNPFNPSTQISYSLAEDADVTLKVYDMLGTEVSELLNEEQPAGSYEITFNGENLSSGVYIYRVIASKNWSVLFTDTKRMILMK